MKKSKVGCCIRHIVCCVRTVTAFSLCVVSPNCPSGNLPLSAAPHPLRVEFTLSHAVSPLHIDGICGFCGSQESLEAGGQDGVLALSQNTPRVIRECETGCAQRQSVIQHKDSPPKRKQEQFFDSAVSG
jgi:hypothetical protein